MHEMPLLADLEKTSRLMAGGLYYCAAVETVSCKAFTASTDLQPGKMKVLYVTFTRAQVIKPHKSQTF